MSATLEFTGERFTPECEREIWYEHFHRYALAARWCGQLRILDAACGEGYGAALLSETAASVEGIDKSPTAITHARQRYGDKQGLKFQVADCTALPFEDDEFDRVVSFETLEHMEEQEQLLSEFRRVLKPDGLLILSSPDKAVYSDQQNTSNEFHIKELYRDELEALISRHFPVFKLLGQKLAFHSAIWSMDSITNVALDRVAEGKLVKALAGQGNVIGQPAMYFIAVCASEGSYLPDCNGKLWLFDDQEESVYQHYHGEIRRNMAAGGIIAGLQNEIKDLQCRLETLKEEPVSWWKRLLGKN